VRLADQFDQATGLRRLFAEEPTFSSVGVLGPDPRRNARASLSLARGISRRGNRVLLMDEARAPYNTGGLAGFLVRQTLAQAPQIGLAAVSREIEPGLRLLAAPDGMGALAGLSEQSLHGMADEWGTEAPEWMLLNSPGGSQGVGLAASAAVRVLVLPGEKSQLAEAYATLKSAQGIRPQGQWAVLVEGASADTAQRLYDSLRDTALRFVGVNLHYLGNLPKLKEGYEDDADAAIQASTLAEALQDLPVDATINFEQFWQRLWLFSRMSRDAANGKAKAQDAQRRAG